MQGVTLYVLYFGGGVLVLLSPHRFVDSFIRHSVSLGCVFVFFVGRCVVVFVLSKSVPRPVSPGIPNLYQRLRQQRRRLKGLDGSLLCLCLVLVRLVSSQLGARRSRPRCPENFLRRETSNDHHSRLTLLSLFFSLSFQALRILSPKNIGAKKRFVGDGGKRCATLGCYEKGKGNLEK